MKEVHIFYILNLIINEKFKRCKFLIHKSNNQLIIVKKYSGSMFFNNYLQIIIDMKIS